MRGAATSGVIYNHPRIEGRTDQTATLRFAAPVRAVTRGQIAVFYAGDRVLGGGRIVSTSGEGT